MDYLTVGQVAKELELTLRGVRYRIEQGMMKAEKLTPRLYLVSHDEVERWRVLGRQKSGPNPRKERQDQGR